MSVTLNCKRVGQEALWNKSAFGDSCLYIANPHKILETKVFLNLQIFWSKKSAVEFCKQYGFIQADITKVESKFQFGYAIGLGRGYYAPIHAEARLVAHALGCVVIGIS